MRKTWNNKIWYLAVFIVPVIILMAVTAANHLFPFGTKTWLLWDQDVQYADYFIYLKQVLRGEAHIGYSFSKSLGGSLVGLFAYYLVSPLNLLVVFFKDSQIPLFLYLITLIKVGLCGTAAAFFFRHHNEKLRQSHVFLLGAGYALMQYTFAQMSNIMWLDGVILLPLILYGADRYLRRKKTVVFSLMIMASVLINWYTAYMNCLFAVLYYLYEYWGGDWHKDGIWVAVKRFAGYLWAELLGVLGSCVLFLPAVLSLSTGKSVFDSRIFNLSVNCPPWAFVKGLVVGSNPGVREIPSFFCGTLVVIFVLYFFFYGKVTVRRKIAAALFLVFMFGVSYFNVLENVFNGMRFVYSYPYRFGYLIVFALLLIGAHGMGNCVGKESESVRFAVLLMGFGAALVLSTAIDPLEHPKYLWISLGMILFFISAFFIQGKYRGYALCVLGCLELGINGFLVMRIVTEESGRAESYRAYVEDANRQQKQLRDYDDSEFYRVEQTASRGSKDDGSRVHGSYSESLSYGYRGIAQYSSSYDAMVSEFVAKLGYSDEVDLTIYDEPILPADSLLGVKYVLSDLELNFYNKIEELETYNGKSVYENPYALPPGFTSSDKILEDIHEENPFLYQNKLFSAILGKEVTLYKPMETETVLNPGVSCYETLPNAEKGLVYAYARTDRKDLQLYVDGNYRCAYSTWLGYLIFQVGESKEQHSVVFQNAEEFEQDINPVFYYLDMEVWEEVAGYLQKHAVSVLTFEDGYVELSYEAEEAGHILTSIPYDDNWQAVIDGEKVNPQRGDGALLVLPVNAGMQKIVLKYSVPGVVAGAMLSAVGFCGILISFYMGKKREKK